MTERVRSQMQESTMRFLQKMKGVTTFVKFVALQIENLSTSSRYFSGSKDFMLAECLRKTSQANFVFLSELKRTSWTTMNKMFVQLVLFNSLKNTKFAWEVFLRHSANMKSFSFYQGSRIKDFIKDLSWNHLGLHLSEMQSVFVDREVWRLIWSCCPRNPQGKALKKTKKQLVLISIQRKDRAF